MSIINTLDFLPEIFQSDPNSKFLNATLDQLVSEPVFTQINGYVGRTFAPTFKVTDSYITEPDQARQNYQLEPGVVVSNSTNTVQFFNSYVDLINKIEYYGGITTNHSRLFSNEAYSFNGLVDFDKLVNFSQYYWLPNGPALVNVFTGSVANSNIFTVTRNSAIDAYQISGFGTAANPDIILARGGTYQFVVNQQGTFSDGATNPKFWIQASPGTNGTMTGQRNISSRDVFGVVDNGAVNGIVTFQVPQSDGQDIFVKMPLVQAVDFATTSRFADIDNQLVNDIVGGIDGVTAANSLAGKYLIFVANDITDPDWDEKGVYELNAYGADEYDQGTLIPNSEREGIWQIQIIDAGGDQLVKLVWVQDIPVANKVSVKAGKQFASFEFYKQADGTLAQVPLITAPLDTLYYNDGSDNLLYGRIRIVDNTNFTIDVPNDILAKAHYTSPNQVVFTNGLMIKFDSTAIPSTYANNAYYVEGVGTQIRLVPVSSLITPELETNVTGINYDVFGMDDDTFDETLGGPITPDYITINRSSVDINAWSRSNRWFHEDVILASATYNNIIPTLDSTARAARPIIEFVPDLQLFGNGKIAYQNIDILDFTITDAYSQVEGSTSDFYTGSGIKDGTTVIFPNDFDPRVVNTVFTVNILNINNVIKVHLRPTAQLIQPYDIVVPVDGIIVPLDPWTGDSSLTFDPAVRHIGNSIKLLSGTTLTGVVGTNLGLLQGYTFWFNGASWQQAPSKVGTNTMPMFDIVDRNGISFGNPLYVNSSFAGSPIFSYMPNSTGVADPILGFPLSYRNFNNIGDIEFTNNIDSDSFTYLIGTAPQAVKLNTGFVPKIIDRNITLSLNVWDKTFEPSKQYQVISSIFNGISSYVEIDILPEFASLVPNLKVYVNSKLISPSLYSIVNVGVKRAVHIPNILTLNDQIDVLIFSQATSAKGYYEIPSALEFNSLNSSFSSLTLGQFRNHLSTIAGNSTEIVGQTPGASNLRDLNIKGCGGSILQHSAPSIYSSLFLTSPDLNFVDSITFAQREYAKFKNRFLESYSAVVNKGITNIPAAVDFILSQLNVNKNQSSPWYYSDMVPYDSNKTLINYTVLNPEIVEYEIDAIFNDTILSNKAVLVYHNGALLTRTLHYSFNQTRPSVILNIPVTVNDQIQIQVFNNTDGCFIPDTPTKLGLYPKFTPGIYIDSTYQTPITVLRSHDGSITPTFGDIRDQLLLELETRIYNNVKIDYDTTIFDIYNYIPGKFRTTDYSRAEFNQIISGNFLTWAGSNRVDFSTNQWFQGSNPFTWNYKKFLDNINGESLPGYWRGIYHYFYDTDAPNMRPWEMLGFSEMPTWWIATYGPAPYTGGNMVLWQDLEAGMIRGGTTPGINPIYARPGLTKIIPVTDSGQLRSPNEFLLKSFNSVDTSGSFSIGDEGPAETAWRRSSEFPFAVQMAIALMKPGLYFGQLANVQAYNRDNPTGQYLVTATNQRITPADLVINGDTTSGSIARSAGYLNWIIGTLVSNSIEPVSTIKGYLNNLSVRLGYKVAGFTDKSYLTILAEQSSPSNTSDSIIIPDENYQILLNKSTPVDRIVYSGVIVEKSASGYIVSGYDLNSPFFTIVPSDTNVGQRQVTVGNTVGVIYNGYKNVKVTVPYGYEFNNTQQVVDFLISYGRYLQAQGFVFDSFSNDLQSVQSWELSVKEFLTWQQQGWAPGNIIVLSPVSNSIKVVYNNAIVDAISNLPTGSKILDTNFNVVKNNLFSVMRNNITFTLTAQPEISIGLIDLSLIQYEHALIFDNQTVFNDIIYKPELGNRQYRLKLIGNKTGNWTGQVSPPGFMYSAPVISSWASGQDYLLGDLISYKNLYYTALQDIPAADIFITTNWQQIDKSAIQTGLLPNFAYNAAKFENMYDIDSQIQDQNIDKFGMGLIGYRSRSYLADLNITETTQSKFYQGYIRDKGTKDAISALANATFNNMSGNLSYYEEWAFRVGEYGALNANQYIEIQLADNIYVNDPINITLLTTGETINDPRITGIYKEQLYKKPVTFKTNIFNDRSDNSYYENDIQTAGYVNLNDIDATLFDIQNIQNLDPIVETIFDGYKIWVAKDLTRDWNVYRVDDMPVQAISITNELDTFATITTNGPHMLAAGDSFVIRNYTTEVDGLYQVVRIDSPRTIFVNVTSTLESILVSVPTIIGTGSMFKLHSLRFTNFTDIINYTPSSGWTTNDKIWIDNDVTGWGVHAKITPWNFLSEVAGNTITTNSNYGQQVAISPLYPTELTTFDINTIPSRPTIFDTNRLKFLDPVLGGTSDCLIAVTSPGNYENNVDLIIRVADGSFITTKILRNTHNPDITVGTALAMSLNSVVVNLVNSVSTNQVSVYALTHANLTIGLSSEYTLNDTTGYGPGSEYGATIAISKDDNWLFVAAPGAGIVQCYTKNDVGVFANPINIYGLTGEDFGASLATNSDGSILIVGSPKTLSGGLVDAGAITVYSRVGLTFTEEQTIISSSPQIYETFGSSAWLVNDGAELLVGAPGTFETTYKNGVVYRYKNVSTTGLHYQLIQEIKKPFTDFEEHFGTSIVVDESSNSLMVSSKGAESIADTIVDAVSFTLDAKATSIIDRTPNSGAVYVYDLITDSVASKYCYSQELFDISTISGDEFGASLAVHQGLVLVGSPGSNIHGMLAGKALLYQNLTRSIGWELLRYQQPTVDIASISKLFLYDSKSETILANLDYIDPAKGKILGVADQDITYKTSFDPANYNEGTNTNVSIDSSYYWGVKQVGQVWWDLSSIRYIDYEQDTLTYRINNWGQLFPGSTVIVSEWVKSVYLPSQYVGDGVPVYPDNSAYVQTIDVNPVTGVIQSTYYYWVKNKITFDANLPFRRSSVSTLASLISSPSTQNIPYAQIVRNDSISLVDAHSFISSKNTILHVDYSLTQTSNLIHNEYELVQDNSLTATIPPKIVNKLIDSLTGADQFGNVVPDYTLGAAERYGILIRPRQTMFVNRLVAVQNFVEYVNSVFLQSPVMLMFDLTKLNLVDPIPTVGVDRTVASFAELSYINTSTLIAGQNILVTNDVNFDNSWTIYTVQSNLSFKLSRTQGYNTTDYWTTADWYDSTYDSTVKPTYTVATTKDMATLALKVNDVIKVQNDGSGRFVIYRTNANLTTSLVGVQNGTIQLKNSLWAHGTNQIGFGNDNFDTVKFDLNPTIEFRNIINAIIDDIFINTLGGKFNSLFFILLDYIFSEQRLVDWAFKTSFISIIHQLRQLAQFPNFINDNQTFYEDYINEVKPYRTQIREYVIKYDGTDSGNMHSTDFDLPAYFDTDFKMWRSPSGEHARDAALISTLPQYADWNNHSKYYIDSVSVENTGYGYTAAPSLTVIGGGGSGAKLEAVVDLYTGSIAKVNVLNPGTGYTSTPIIQVFGDGVDANGDQTFRCYPILRNDVLRTINTTIKFDRIQYASDVVQWSANTIYIPGTLISFEGTVYTPLADITSNTFFDPSQYTKVDANSLDAMDRVLAYYKPTAGMPPADSKQLFKGTEYPGVEIDGVNYIASNNVELDTNIQSLYTDLALGTRPEDVNIDGSAYVDAFSSHAPEELLPGMMFDTVDIKVFTILNPDAPTVNPMGFRITKPMSPDINNQPWEFRRISANSTTTLAQDLLITDTEIFVTDASALPIPSITLAHPGVVYINSEKITYWTVDLTNNSLGQIRRGAWGTGAPPKHKAGTLVVDASIDQQLPGDNITTTWLNPGVYGITIVDGNGLKASNSSQAVFIRAEPSYLPYLPSTSGLHIDPNAHLTRFDDNGSGEIGTPPHPFDGDPFDSFNPG